MSGERFQNIEIFRAGDYGPKGSYSESDLAAMASAYSPDVHDAPLTVDHKKTGPAFGWIRNLRAMGERLLADFHDVPTEFADAIRGGAFKQRSAEIYPSFQGTGRPYLRAVTMLGAAAPAVKGMDPIKFSDDAGDFETFDAEPIRFVDPEKPAPKFSDFSIDELADAIAASPKFKETIKGALAMSDKPADQKNEPTPPAEPAKNDGPTAAEFAEIKAQAEADRKQAAADRAELNRLRNERRDEKEGARFESAFSEALREGKVTPAEKDSLAFAFSALPHDDAENVATFGESKDTPRAAFLAAFKARPQVVKFGDALAPKAGETQIPDGKVSSFDDRVAVESERRAREKGIKPGTAEFNELVETVAVEMSA